MATIREGMAGDLVLEDETNHTPVAVMPVMVRSLKEKLLVVSQTSPPLSESQKGRRFIFSFLASEDGKTVRFGCVTQFVGLTESIIAGRRIPELVLERKSNPEVYNLRMSHRINPPPNRGLALLFRGKPLAILDISTGGARLSTKEELELKAGDRVPVTIVIDERRFEVEARVVRIFPARELAAGGPKQVIAIQFINNSVEMDSLLAKKIILLEREQISRGIR